MKYKVGDKVKIRENLKEGECDGNIFVESGMLIYLGKEATIVRVPEFNYYELDVDGSFWAWTDEMLEDAKETVPTVDGWNSVKKNGLPKEEQHWERFLVNVLRSHYPTSTYDIVDAPYDEEFVIPAMYDSQQKIWHLDCDEQLNALFDIEDAPLNGDYVTHWMPMPKPPKED